jgi:phospholipid/cholesterol/gamma-HCH transport system permease protein
MSTTHSHSARSLILNFFATIGRNIREGIASLGFATRSFFNLLGVTFGAMKRPALISEQIHFIGNYSLVIIAVSGLFVGMVLGLQGYYTLNQYGAEQKLGQVVALALCRELGPVVTALLFAGRAGTSLTAQIGLMKAGEQLSAMEMMAINPIQRVLAPRFWAGAISVPLLASIFSAVGILGGWLVGVQLIGVDEGAFWSQMQGGVDVWKDIFNGFAKSVVFGIAITYIALYQGYEADPTPEDVSGATTRTVVISSLMIWWLDFMLTALMFSK